MRMQLFGEFFVETTHGIALTLTQRLTFSFRQFCTLSAIYCFKLQTSPLFISTTVVSLFNIMAWQGVGGDRATNR